MLFFTLPTGVFSSERQGRAVLHSTNWCVVLRKVRAGYAVLYSAKRCVFFRKVGGAMLFFTPPKGVSSSGRQGRAILHSTNWCVFFRKVGAGYSSFYQLVCLLQEGRGGLFFTLPTGVSSSGRQGQATLHSTNWCVFFRKVGASYAILYSTNWCVFCRKVGAGYFLLNGVPSSKKGRIGLFFTVLNDLSSSRSQRRSQSSFD